MPRRRFLGSERQRAGRIPRLNRASPQARGLVNFWSLSTPGVVRDLAGQAHSTSIESAVTFGASEFGLVSIHPGDITNNSIDLDAAGFNPSLFTDQLTVHIWGALDTITSYGMIFSIGSNNPFSLEMRQNASTGKMETLIDTDADAPRAARSLQNIEGTGFRALAGRYDGATVSNFTDGILDGTKATNGNIDFTDAVLAIGNRAGTNAHPWNGRAVSVGDEALHRHDFLP